ncbi:MULTISPECIES: hypothetical protein [Mediterraneibacter]|jgi:hypothetical protein|uniref:hypothetical protein n=1 Tax=Mediterraneibacter TaxID=2316020 RepID=UPI0022E4852C|nr:hypothetical protein [Mediterraneibacter massiliensis]
MVYQWELEKVKDWSVSQLKNRIHREVDCGQPAPGNVSVTAMRMELLRRGEEPVGYHNT